jgi:hypothetical protein
MFIQLFEKVGSSKYNSSLNTLIVISTIKKHTLITPYHCLLTVLNLARLIL